MTTAQREAHFRLLATLPVRTHHQYEPPTEVNKYTRKPTHHDTSRSHFKQARTNTWIEKSPKVER